MLIAALLEEGWGAHLEPAREGLKRFVCFERFSLGFVFPSLHPKSPAEKPEIVVK